MMLSKAPSRIETPAVGEIERTSTKIGRMILTAEKRTDAKRNFPHVEEQHG